MMPAQTDTAPRYPSRTAWRRAPKSPRSGAILRAAGLLGPEKRIAYLGLLDPASERAGGT